MLIKEQIKKRRAEVQELRATIRHLTSEIRYLQRQLPAQELDAAGDDPKKLLRWLRRYPYEINTEEVRRKYFAILRGNHD